MSWELLSFDVWLVIFDEVGIEDIVHTASTCKDFHAFLTRNLLWEKLFARLYGRRDRHYAGLSKNSVLRRFKAELNWSKRSFTKRAIKVAGDRDSLTVIEVAEGDNFCIVGGEEGKLHKVSLSGPEMTSQFFGSHDGLIWCGHLINNENHFISSGHDSKLKLWDVSTHALLSEIPSGHKGGIWEVAHRSGHLYTTGNDGTVRSVDAETGAELFSTRISRSYVWNLAPVWARNLLIASSQDSVVHFLDARSGQVHGRMRAEEQLTLLKYLPSYYPEALLGGDTQGMVSCWDLRALPAFVGEPDFTIHDEGEPRTVQQSLPAALPTSSKLGQPEKAVCKVSLASPLVSFPHAIRDIAADATKVLVATRGHEVQCIKPEDLFCAQPLKPVPSALCIGDEADMYKMALRDTQLLVGTRGGELMGFDFSQNTSFWEEWIEEGTKVVDNCNVM